MSLLTNLNVQGGFKQVHPPRRTTGDNGQNDTGYNGYYSNYITLNDKAMIYVLDFFTDIYLEIGEFDPDVKEGTNEDDPESIILKKDNSHKDIVKNGVQFLIDAQIKNKDGLREGWCQQYASKDTPRPGRRYEPIAMATTESKAVTDFLGRNFGDILDNNLKQKAKDTKTAGETWLGLRKDDFHNYINRITVNGSKRYDPQTGSDYPPKAARFYAIPEDYPNTEQTPNANDIADNVFEKDESVFGSNDEHTKKLLKNSGDKIDSYSWHYDESGLTSCHWTGPREVAQIKVQCEMPRYQYIYLDAQSKPDTLIASVPEAYCCESFTYEWSPYQINEGLEDIMPLAELSPPYCVTVTDSEHSLGICCIEFGSPGGSGSGSGSGSGTSSTTTKQLIETPNIPSIIAPELSLDIFPNPVQSDMTISVNSSTSDLFQLQIFNLNGQAIYQEQNYVLKGNYERRLTLPDDIPNGIYFVRVQTEMGSAMKKIVVAR